MKFCCARCFGDRGLTGIIEYRATRVGTCDYCGCQDCLLVDPRELANHFELLLGIYVPNADGKMLVEWFRDDWGLFAGSSMDDAHAKELLAEVLDDGEIVRRTFIPSLDSSVNRYSEWQSLREELMHRNRFFPNIDLDLDTLRRALSALVVSVSEIGDNWYRARIQSHEGAFTADSMGAPPPRLASHGRANPAGIPYLYLGSSKHTAVSEIRPHTGEQATVARFVLGADLQVIDLRDPRRAVSPFPPFFEDEEEIASLRNEISFLQSLGEELTRPVLPRSAAIDYIPSQYLCEFIKQSGYDGVLYRSSVSEGANLALFDPSAVTPREVSTHIIERVSVDIS